MEWITDERPPHSGIYLVSINWQREHGLMLFTYMAYYLSEENEWYKHDPFIDNFKPMEKIEGYVTAWADNLSVQRG